VAPGDKRWKGRRLAVVADGNQGAEGRAARGAAVSWHIGSLVGDGTVLMVVLGVAVAGGLSRTRPTRAPEFGAIGAMR
jgi:hypothetical protein